MKRCLLGFLTVLSFTAAQAQQEPGKRYYDKVFTSVQKDPDIKYGANYSYNSLNGEAGLTQQDLTLDIYYPSVGDTETKRPLIIWAHGGSFLNGTKDDADIVYFCNEFAKRGFVCASINYRLGYELPIDSANAVRAVYRALQDGRAAVRYMRSVADTYGIDKDRVYFGGTSAGAFVAMNMVYLNLPEELPNYVDTSGHDEINTDPKFGLDGIEGKTNLIEESSTISGIINFCGATKTVSWMDDEYSRSIPIISMHGTNDSTVPYGTRIIYLNDLTPIPPQAPVPIVEVQGSYDIDKHAKAEGYTSRFYTWYGADHVPYINFENSENSKAYMDSLMSFTVRYVYQDFLGLGDVAGLDENDPPCDFNNGVVTPCEAQNVVEHREKSLPAVYPNPSSEGFFITVQEAGNIVLIDQLGKKILEQTCPANCFIATDKLKNGVYQLLTDDHKQSHKLMVLH